MKQIFVMAIAALSLVACDNQKSTETTLNTADTSAAVVTTDTYTPTNVYVPAEGDVTYRDGKLMVYRNGNYVVADNDVTLEGGVVVRRNGEVTREGKVVKLEEGESVSKAGKFFNKAGEGIEDAWDATKKGVKKAGEAVKKAGEKVGEEVKDAVN